MAYNNAIPKATDNLSTSQPQLQANFMEIATAFNLNHVNFNATGEGKHSFVEMPNQSTPPFTPPTTIANETGLYCNSSTFTNQPELFFIKQNGTTAPVPLNGINGYEISSSNYVANGGWTRLPSGILVRWGNATQIGVTTQTFELTGSATLPVFTTLYQVYLTDASGTVRYYSVSNIIQPAGGAQAKFTVLSSLSGINAAYLAIGV